MDRSTLDALLYKDESAMLDFKRKPYPFAGAKEAQKAEMLKDISEGEGDLTKRLNIIKQDELGELAGYFNAFLDKLQGMVKKKVEPFPSSLSTHILPFSNST